MLLLFIIRERRWNGSENQKKTWRSGIRLLCIASIEVCKNAASKYTRSKVRKALPEEFAYVIEELITVRPEISDKESYYNAIVSMIIETKRAGEFIVALSELIQRLTVDHLHIVGDIFDRGLGLILLWIN